MDSDAARARFDEAKRLHHSGDHRAALAVLEELDLAYPNTKNILLARAECLIQLGDAETAARACEQVLASHDDARAGRLLAQCRDVLANQTDGWVEVVDDTVPPLPGTAPAPRTPRRRLKTLPVLLCVGVIVIGVASAKAYQISRAPEGTGRITAAEVAAATRALSPRTGAIPEPVAEPEWPRQIPESEWNVSIPEGVPDWKPGAYRQVPVPGTWFEPWEGPRTIDVFIPTAYETEPETLLPTLTITMPMVNPGFREYERWAERRGVILIVLNSSANAYHVRGNREAQLSAYDFLYGHIRSHPHLNFTYGVSGGAQMGWVAASNSPDLFSGVLMSAHGGYRELALEPHIRVAYINGEEDWNARYILEMIGRLRRNGNPVKHAVVPGGHIEGPLDVRTRLLDWLLDSSRADLEALAAE